MRCFIVARAAITATPFIWLQKVVAYLDLFTRSLESTHQQVIGI